MIAIELDMPQNCLVCPLGRVLNCEAYRFNCKNELVTIDISERPANCPLKKVNLARARQIFREEDKRRCGEHLEEFAKQGIQRKMVEFVESSGAIKYCEHKEMYFGDQATVIEGMMSVVEM